MLGFAVAFEGFGCGVGGVGHGIADDDILDGFDVGDDETDFAGADGVDGFGFGHELAEVGDGVEGAFAHEADFLALGEFSVHDADVDDDAAVVVVFGIEDEALERGVGIAFGGREAFGDEFEEVIDAESGLGGDGGDGEGVDAEDLFHFLGDIVGAGGGEIDLVDDGDDFEVLVDGGVGVGDGLGLDALGGITEEQCAFAGLEGFGDFVVKVDVAGGVDEVVEIFLAGVGVGVEDGHGGSLDGDAAFFFKVHVVEELGFHFALGDGACELEESVGEGGLAVVDVGDDAEVSDLNVAHGTRLVGVGLDGFFRAFHFNGFGGCLHEEGGGGEMSRAGRVEGEGLWVKRGVFGGVARR